jgi:hypothetical protein
MTPEKFLQDLLDSQNLKQEQELTLKAHKKEVTDYLIAEFQDKNPTIKYAGSYEKGTMIRDCYDLDIVCYFPDTDTRTLKEIRDDVSVHLNKKYLMQDKASAERILSLKGVTAPQSYHIDVVPGRFISGSNDVFLHLAEGEKERLQTNLKTHISHIKDSGCVPIIRLIKVWAHRNNVKVKTFLLELFVVEALSGSRSKSDLKVSFLKVLEEMKNRFATIELVDPANTGNVVSRLMPTNEKTAVAQVASKAFEALGSQDNLAVWENVFNETVPSTRSTNPGLINTPRTTPNTGFIPHSPHSDYANGDR